jgi:hypothetical protein
MMFISRGHGRGHAVPDMAIAAKLIEHVPNLGLQFVSYAAGADAYRARGYSVIDVNVEDNPPFLDMVVAFARLLDQNRPELIVAHEEVPAITVADAFKIPSVFITDFFSDPSGVPMKELRRATEILFLGQRGLFTEPPYLAGRTRYLGRAVRKFEYTLADRKRARIELSIPPEATVLFCQPGAWVESQLPLAELLSAAWHLLPVSPRRLIWLAGRDYERLSAKFAEQPDITVLKEDWQIDRILCASDVVITKANRVTVFESASLGLPSISISTFANWPDDVAVSAVDSNTALFAGAVTPQELANVIATSIKVKHTPATELSGGVKAAADRIADHVKRLRARSETPTQTLASATAG